VIATTLAGPFRGLAAFGDSERDASLFFGRERETEVVTANLIGTRLTVLYGPSGVGKSSLLRAGVARRIRELGARRAVGRGPDLACVVFASWSADDPVRALSEAIAAEIAPLLSPTTPAPPDDVTLAEVAEHWTAALDGDLCLVLDQIEEYFVYHEDDRSASSLLRSLPALVTQPGLRTNVLLSLRDDELARLDVFKESLPGVFANPRRLDRLDRAGGRAAILGPIERWDGPQVEIEPELVESVLDQSSVEEDEGRIEAPVLQLVMERLWDEERARGSNVLRQATLDELGGAAAIVREHLDRALAVLDDDQQEAAAAMFGHLVTPSGTKIAHRASDLAAFARVPPDVGRDVLGTLGRERILRTLDDGDEGDRYEIFHDVLAEAVLDWGRRREVEAERAAGRRRLRRLTRVAVAALLGLAVMAAIAVYALAQRHDARARERHARASALAARALAVLPLDPELSLLLARDAAEEQPTRDVEDVLRTALTASRARGILRGQTAPVLAAGFSGGKAATFDADGSLRLYPIGSGRATTTEHVGGHVRAASFSGDGEAVAVARRRLVTVQDVATGKVELSFRSPSPIRALATDGNGARVATATLDHRVTVRERGGGTFVAQPSFAPTAVALDAAGDLVAASGGRSASVWRVGSARPLATIGDRADVLGVALAPDGSLLATASADGGARIWKLPSGQLLNVVLATGLLKGVTFSHDGAFLALQAQTGTVRIYEVVTGRLAATLAGHTSEVVSAQFSPDEHFFVTGAADGARLWDPGASPELRVIARPPQCCTTLRATPAGALVAAGSRAFLYRGRTLVRTFAQSSPVTAVAGTNASVVTGGADGAVRVWPTRGGQVRVLARGGPVTAVAAGEDAVAAADGARVRVWSNDGNLLSTVREDRSVQGLAISHDGTLLATADADGVGRIRTLATGALVDKLVGHTKALTAVAFSPDDAQIATASFDHDMRLWSTATGELEHRVRAHFAVVSDVEYSADGRWLVTAGSSSAGLWRADDGTGIKALRGPGPRVVGVGFTPDDHDVVSASTDGTVREYRCDICGDVDALVALASARLAATGRTLTPAERARYLAP